MFAKKVLISLALVAAMPLALSRHMGVFPDDLVPNFPPNNIEDLHISQGDVIPDVETQPDFGEDDNQGQIQDIFGGGVAPNYDDTVKKVHSMVVRPEVEEVDYSENDTNNENNDPNQGEVIVPEENLNARQQEPVVIMVRADEQSQDYPDYNDDTENKNEEIQTWDDDEGSNDIPLVRAPSHKGWNRW